MIIARDAYREILLGEWEQLERTWPNASRLDAALRLARDVDTCAALLRGEHFDPEALDPGGLEWARERMLVSLAPAIDLLEVAA